MILIADEKLVIYENYGYTKKNKENKVLFYGIN